MNKITRNASLCCLLCRYTEQAIEQTVDVPVISDAMSLQWCHFNVTKRNIERSLLRPDNGNTLCGLHSEMLVTLVPDVTAPSPKCYCTIALNKGAVTAASPGSTIADLALTTTRQHEPCIPWSRLTHILPCHTLIPIVWALVCATEPPVRSPTNTSANLNESVTVVTASRFSPVLMAAICFVPIHLSS